MHTHTHLYNRKSRMYDVWYDVGNAAAVSIVDIDMAHFSIGIFIRYKYKQK